MSNVTVKGASIEQTIKEAFDVTEAVVNQAATDCSMKAARRVRGLIRTAAIGGHRYNYGWKVKKEHDGAIVYQSAQPGLTHLLENGHPIVRNGVKVGDSPSIPHIKPAEEIGVRYFEEIIQEEIERRLSE